MSPAGAAKLTIAQATTPEEIEAIRALFLDYAASLDFDLQFQGFANELASLPGAYAPPGGRLLIARYGQSIAGGVGLRPLEPGICEMKRLYVRPAYRKLKVGRLLAEAIIEAARALGYDTMRLDTMPSMEAAQALYRSLGFCEIAAYYPNPHDELRYYGLDLTGGA